MRLARLVPLLVLAGALLAFTTADARPGGGQNYSGGGRSSSSSGRGSSSSGGYRSGGGGGGDPVVGLIVLGVIITIVIVQHLRNGDRSTRRAVEQLAADEIRPNTDGLAALAARDPGFSMDALLARLRSMIDVVNRAWSDGDMAGARRVISDGVYVRFQSLIGLLARSGLRNRTADTEVLELAVVAIETDGDWDAIHVKVTARARDADVSTSLDEAAQAREVAGTPVTVYHEVWSLLRRVGAKTLVAGGALEGRCPKCGADVPLANVVKCGHCRGLVNSGEHDWVLAEITQVVEWRRSSTGRRVPGFEAMRARDPGFNRQHVEDRASVLFWKWIEARATGEAKRLARWAASPPEHLGVRAGEAVPHHKVAVGSVDLAACDGATDGGRDRCYVKVLWSAAPDRSREPTPFSTVLVLARDAGVVTAAGLSSLSCRECNGALADSDALTCEYCGAAVAAGKQEWALEEMTTPEAAERSRWQRARAAEEAGARDAGGAAFVTARIEARREVPLDVPDLADPRERLALLWRMAAVVAADGVVEPRERKLLEVMAKRWSIPMSAIEPALRAGDAALATTLALSEADRRPFLAALVAAALVDGRVDRRERKLLESVRHSLALPEGTVDELIKKAA